MEQEWVGAGGDAGSRWGTIGVRQGRSPWLNGGEKKRRRVGVLDRGKGAAESASELHI